MAAILSALLALSPICFAYSPASALDGAQVSETTTAANPAPDAPQPQLSHRPAIAVQASSLGFGGQFAVPLSQRSNLRVGVNLFNTGLSFSKDGINYGGHLKLSSVQATYDYFPFNGGFHISPGALVYNNSNVAATAFVSGGRTISLGGTTYTSSPSNPLTGRAALGFNQIAPMFLIGYGNLARRGDHHFVASFDIGAAYVGGANTTLTFTGSACDAHGANCTNVGHYTSFLSSVISEQSRITGLTSPFRLYPVVQLALGYRF